MSISWNLAGSRARSAGSRLKLLVKIAVEDCKSSARGSHIRRRPLSTRFGHTWRFRHARTSSKPRRTAASEPAGLHRKRASASQWKQVPACPQKQADTLLETHAELALLVAPALDVAAAAVLAVRERVDAFLLAHRVTWRTAHCARPSFASSAAAVRIVAHRCARAAVRGIAVEVHALRPARAVPAHARESTLTVVTPARGVCRSAANFSTRAAVVRVGIGVRTRATAVRGPARAVLGAGTIEAHLVRRAGPAALAAV